jgi:uncharacterized membrane protein YqjE
MNPNDLPGGLPSRVAGVSAGLLSHLLSLGSLAALEWRLFLRQGIGALLLIVAGLVVAAIAYVALVVAVVAILATQLGWGWPVSLAAAGILHLALLGLLARLLRTKLSVRPFEATTAELRRDLDHLDSLAGRHRP